MKVKNLPKDNPTRVGFNCPGCGLGHWLPTDLIHGEGETYLWGFNGDYNKPTFTPSILSRWRDRDSQEEPIKNRICHSFVTNGSIRFLDDCTHKLKGQTVELPEIE